MVTGGVTVSFVSPETFWAVRGVLVCASVATYLRAATAAYVFDRSTIVKPSWVISAAWEAFWNCVRRVLSPDGATGEALIVVVLPMVRAVPFFAEVRVFKCVDVGDMDTLSWFEVMVAVCRVWGVANEVGYAYGCGRSVLVSVDLVLVQFADYSPTSCLGGFKA